MTRMQGPLSETRLWVHNRLVAMVCTIVLGCISARGQEPSTHLEFVTPRTIFRNNTVRLKTKNAPTPRDSRFIAEPGFRPTNTEQRVKAAATIPSTTPKAQANPANRRILFEPSTDLDPSSTEVVVAPTSYSCEGCADKVASSQVGAVLKPAAAKLILGNPVVYRDDQLPVPPTDSMVGPMELIRPNVDAGTFSIDQIIENAMNVPLLRDRPIVKLSINDILARTLANAKNVQVLRIQPIEDRQFIEQEFGQFDWAAFFETRLGRNVSPVRQQNQFANANQTEIRSDAFQFAGGLRKETTLGGQLQISESMRFTDEDSGLLNPADQAISQLSVIFSQELLRDGGRDVVLSQALIASYQADQSHAASISQISQQLQSVLNEYWALFENRSNYFVQLALTRWAHETLKQLEDRRRIDAEENTIEQARALLLEAQANLIDAKVQVQISQDRLYRLVNDPAIDPDQVEIITTHPPAIGSLHFDPRTELETAMQNRGEVYERLAEIAQAAIEHHVSLNQLLPKLTVSIESSLNGIEGNRKAFTAKANSLNTQPSVEANFNLEFFLSNRIARATNRQTQLRIRRLQFEYEDQIEQLRLDVSEAVRTLNAATGAVDLRSQTLISRRRELEYLRLRRDVVPLAGANVSLLLEQFFQALNRLVASQQAYVNAKANVQRALVDLQRAKGLLIHHSELPMDEFVPVPNVPRAFREQLRGRWPQVINSRHRVVTPAVNKRWELR